MGMQMTFPAREVSQDTVLKFQVALSRFEQLECPVRHYFSKGLYLREIFMPKGAFVVGKLHATEHPNIISCGDCSVWTAIDGMQRIQAPYTWISKPGVKKALYIHEDTIWTTCHVTDKTDLDELERELIIEQPTDGGFSPEEADAMAMALSNEVRSLLQLEYLV